MIGSSAPVQLPNSKLSITIGPSQAIIPDTNDYFEEYRGFYPDLWVPAGEGEELAVKLLEQNAQERRAFLLRRLRWVCWNRSVPNAAPASPVINPWFYSLL